MHIVYSILLAFICLILGFLIRNKIEGGKVFDYFATPGRDHHLELNWAGRQFFLLFSKGMSERWYEARAHLYQGVFISLLSTFHLIHIVRIEYETSRDCYISYVIFKTHGFQSLATLEKKMPEWIKTKKAEAKDAQHWYQTFVCGHNVIGDFMNGFFDQRNA
jgi:hypothetical protein